MVELADTLALGASAARHAGSNPVPGTISRGASKVTSLGPWLCVVLMIFAVVRSQRKLRTAFYGVLAVTMGVVSW